MAVHGEMLAGMVDRVPRVGYVVTQFHHFNFVPIAPMGSYFVFLGPQAMSVQIPLSWKSVGMGCFRGVIGVATFVCSIWLAVTIICTRLQPNPWHLGLSACLFVTGIALLLASYHRRFLRASYARARELARMLDLPFHTRLMIDVEYGMKSATQAELELANYESGEVVELAE